MKKLYHKYTQLSSPIQLTILLLVLFITFTLIDWMFDGKSAFLPQSIVQTVMEVVVLTVIFNFKLVANAFGVGKKSMESIKP